MLAGIVIAAKIGFLIISGEEKVNYFAQLYLILEAQFDNERFLNLNMTPKVFPNTALWQFNDFQVSFTGFLKSVQRT